AADRVELLDLPRQLVMHQRLEPDVDRKRQGLVAPSQLLVESLLDAGDAASVDIGEPDDMGGQRAQGIDPLLLGLEGDAGNAQPVDLVMLTGRQPALEPDEAPVAA